MNVLLKTPWFFQLPVINLQEKTIHVLMAHNETTKNFKSAKKKHLQKNCKKHLPGDSSHDPLKTSIWRSRWNNLWVDRVTFSLTEPQKGHKLTRRIARFDWTQSFAGWTCEEDLRYGRCHLASSFAAKWLPGHWSSGGWEDSQKFVV